jgi:eukaryotic-like serine/threonine-protein kinase
VDPKKTEREHQERSGRALPRASIARTMTMRATRGKAPEALVGPGFEPRLRLGSSFVNDRIQVLRCVGEGGMGTVYEVFDSLRGVTVALKTLNRVDPASIYQLKNEFRSLCGVYHRNLIRLHELFYDAGSWFFTMEFVQGVTFDSWVRPAGVLDPLRLRAALGQLVAGLDAVHAAGKLHRDLKPSNVLVTVGGELIILDFGLATDPRATRVGATDATLIVGTPAYMAPEQAAGAPATVASDLYAVGVMLFEALTGELPFSGSVAEVMMAKLRDPAPRLAGASDPELGELPRLCSELLARAPAERPSSAALRGALPRRESRPPLRVSSHAPVAPDIVGRDAELAVLRASYEATLHGGQATVVLVSGESGIGKTSLCDALLRELRGQGHAVVLASRCYERESVPFKAFDALVDELSRYLRSQPAQYAAALLPRDVFALARLFPVLSRVDVIAEAPAKPIQDPFELQRRAFAAFHELLSRIRDRQPLVIYIDDLQWSDPDSEKLMRHLFVHRELVPALFIISHRSDDLPRNASIQRVVDTLSANRNLQSRLLRLGPLDPGSARTLAGNLMRSGGLAADDPGDVIARECGGNPFLATELARFASLERWGRELDSFSLSEVLRARVDALPSASRSLLQALALVGQPVAIETALDATAATHVDLDALRSSGLIRAHHYEGLATVECYHDRIRESVSEQLTAGETRNHYEQLARALASGPAADPELQCRCYAEAGEPQRAAECAVRAADAASAALAFEHAASWYQRALTLGSYAQLQELELTASWADALANAGLGAEAATAYRRAAALSAGPHALDLRRRAAEQLLATGNVSDGFRLLQDVCVETNVRLPSHPGKALAMLAWSSTRMRLRGLEPVPRRSMSPHDAIQLETARTAVLGLNGYLPLHAASLASSYLQMALKRGDRRHLASAFGANAVGHTLIDPRSRWARALLERMSDLVVDEQGPELPGLAAMVQSAVAYDRGEFAASRAHATRAIPLLRTCHGLSIELDASNLFEQLAASALGDYVHVARSAPPLIDEAFQRGRIWLGAMLSGNAAIPAWLAPDDAQGYRDQLDEAHRYWLRRSPPQWPDYALATGEAMLSLYVGEPERGARLLEHERVSFRRSLLTRGSGSRSLRFSICLGSCAVAALRAAAQSGRTDEVRAWTAAVRGACAALVKSGAPAWVGLATCFEAGCALAQGEPQRAVGLLRGSLELLDSAGVSMHAAGVRRRLGQHLGGDEGKSLVALAEQQLRAQEVANIAAMTEFLCPGCRV